MSLVLNSGFTIGPGAVLDANYMPPPPPTRYAFVFDGASCMDVTGNTGDWAFGDTGTIEFWINPDRTSAESPGGFLGAIMTQNNGGNNGIDSWIAGGLAVTSGANNYGVYTEPAPNTWTHVAWVFNGIGVSPKIFLNGQQQTLTGGQQDSGQFNNSTDSLVVGRRGSNNFQYISAKMSDIRINTTAVYTANFTPPAGPLTEIAGTVLLITGTLTDQTSRHTIYNAGVTVVEAGTY
jgi:hypothetical protein